MSTRRSAARGVADNADSAACTALGVAVDGVCWSTVRSGDKAANQRSAGRRSSASNCHSTSTSVGSPLAIAARLSPGAGNDLLPFRPRTTGRRQRTVNIEKVRIPGAERVEFDPSGNATVGPVTSRSVPTPESGCIPLPQGDPVNHVPAPVATSARHHRMLRTRRLSALVVGILAGVGLAAAPIVLSATPAAAAVGLATVTGLSPSLRYSGRRHRRDHYGDEPGRDGDDHRPLWRLCCHRRHGERQRHLLVATSPVNPNVGAGTATARHSTSR